MTNRFKGWDLVDRVPEELWTEVCNTVQEMVTKTIPKKKKCQEGKMIVWGGLTNCWEKMKNKRQGERERYTQLNVEIQRTARRDKKAFLSEQCKEIEENNRMGKTRALFMKITDTKGIFHAKMGTIKDRNGKGITETEELKKRWQEYTEELYEKGFNELDNHYVWSFT